MGINIDRYGEVTTDCNHDPLPNQRNDLEKGFPQKPLTNGRHVTDQGTMENNRNLRENDEGYKWD